MISTAAPRASSKNPVPEGDTILRSATTLRARLVGKEVLRWESTLPAIARAKMVGRTVERIESVGKNLFIVFDDRRSLHTHMRMTGSWHVYPQNIDPRTLPGSARVLIEVEGCVAVCFSAPVIRLLSDAEVDREVKTLGPDILGSGFDADDAARRIVAQGERPIGEVVMDQGVIAGIGNIYKSESLYIARIDPFAACATLGLDRVRALVLHARRIMRRNIAPGSGMRTTRIGAGGRHWVYRRSGEPCFTCGDRIRMLRQGVQKRSTYYCPRCQKVTLTK